MVNTRKNHIGEKKNHLTIVKQVEDYVDPKGIHRAKFACQCDCGNPNLVEVLYTNFQKGTTTSCGCHHQKVITQKGRGIKKNNYDLTGEYGISLISTFCRNEINHNRCTADTCEFCPMNVAYEKIQDSESSDEEE